MTHLLLSLMIGLLPIAATLWVKVMLFRQNESEEDAEFFPFVEANGICNTWKRLPVATSPAPAVCASPAPHGYR